MAQFGGSLDKKQKGRDHFQDTTTISFSQKKNQNKLMNAIPQMMSKIQSMNKIHYWSNKHAVMGRRYIDILLSCIEASQATHLDFYVHLEELQSTSAKMNMDVNELRMCLNGMHEAHQNA